MQTSINEIESRQVRLIGYPYALELSADLACVDSTFAVSTARKRDGTHCQSALGDTGPPFRQLQWMTSESGLMGCSLVVRENNNLNMSLASRSVCAHCNSQLSTSLCARIPPVSDLDLVAAMSGALSFPGASRLTGRLAGYQTPQAGQQTDG